MKEAERPALEIPGAHQACKLKVDFGYYNLVCREHTLTTNMDWNLQLVGIALLYMDVAVVASVSGTAFSAAAVVVLWLPAALFVIAADTPGTRLSAAASAPVSVRSASASACPVQVLADAPSRGAVRACSLKKSGPRELDQALLAVLRI